MWKRIGIFVLACIGLMGAGCGPSGPELREVTGTVTVNGKPVTGAVLTFVPVAGGSPSYGATDREGKYRLAFTDTKFGAMVGEHEVEIAANKISASERAEMKAQGMEVPEQQVTIPKKYREKGALKATVERKANVIDFPLTTD